jgi:hypothetical protein
LAKIEFLNPNEDIRNEEKNLDFQQIKTILSVDFGIKLSSEHFKILQDKITTSKESQKSMDPEQLLARINLKSENITRIDFENLCKLQTAFTDNVPFDNCDIFLDVRSKMNL